MEHVWRLGAFRAAHLENFAWRGRTLAGLEGFAPPEELARRYEAAGPAWTVFRSGEALFAGGAVRFWPGVGECWFFAAAGVDAHSVGVARQALRLVCLLATRHGFRRLQLHVREEDQRAARFAEFLGFAPEGRCPAYGPDGSNYQRYGRVSLWKQ